MRKIVVTITLLSLLFAGCISQESDDSNELVKLRVGGPRQELSNLIYIASEKGFFEEKNLDVEIVDLSSGVEAMEYLLDEEIDVALTSEFVSVSNLFKYDNILIISSIAEADVVEFIGRKDKGINSSEDLVGKTIGITKKSSAESFFGIYLTLNGFNLDNVTLVDMNPNNLTKALKNGTVDGIVIWPPHSFNMKQYFDDNVTSFSIQSDQPFYWQVVINNQNLMNSSVYERFLSALIDAEDFSEDNPLSAQNILMKWMQKKQNYVDYFWPKHDYKVTLSQNMILLMEVEAEFSIEQNLTSASVVPNYLDYINPEYLSTIDAERVNIL